MTRIIPAAAGPAHAFLFAILAGCLASVAVILTGNADHPILAWTYPALIIATGVSLLWRAITVTTDRLAWTLMAAAAFCWGMAQVVYGGWIVELESLSGSDGGRDA